MRIPKQQKYVKQQKGRAFNKINNILLLNKLHFGNIALKAVESGRITSKQLDALYQCINKNIKKSGRVVLKIFPQTPISKKPIEVRMGKGKGNVAYWVAKVKAGSILCEVTCLSQSMAYNALLQAQYKLPIKTKIF